jgi:two-component system chemotaxis sensor kinase CheA
MIIEEIADPLIHVIRNAVDHGIEPASTRRAIGKPEKGLLKLDAYHEGSHVVVEVTDDGRGINPEVIKSTALKKGLVNRDQLSRMSPKEITELIMRPGFSTAAQVTRTSGRGVGMDVVRKNLENLNGTIEIESQPGTGTSIRIKIPLTLAVIKALLVKVRNALFTIPLIAVDETLQVRKKDINSIKGNEVIYLRDSTIPLIRVSTIFNLPGRTSSQAIEEEKAYVVIVSAGNSRVGLVVDELRGQEEVVIKPLPDYLRDNKGFSGATILGDGRISLILDIQIGRAHV